MAKLSARGRGELYRVEKRLEFAGPYYPGEYSADYMTTIKAANETEWSVFTSCLMTDRKVLEKHKWKDHKWEKPFEKGWTVRGTLKAEVTPEQWLEAKLKAGYVAVNVPLTSRIG